MKVKKNLKHVLTVTNLFPTPEKPTQGMFTINRFEALSGLLRVSNCCLVPSFKPWRWSAIGAWQSPLKTSFTTRYQPVFYLPLIGRSLAAQFYANSLRFRKSIQKQISKTDLIYVPWLYPDGTALTRLTQKWPKPIWLMAQGSDTFHLKNRCRRRQLLIACERVCGIICVAPQLAQKLEVAGVDPQKLHVVPNGVDTRIFQNAPRETVLAALQTRTDPPLSEVHLKLMDCLKRGAKLYLYVGNITFAKGTDLLIEAWMRFFDQLPLSPEFEPPHLVIIGTGPLASQLKQSLEKTGNANHAHFLGTRPQNQVAQWMNLADCLCLTSRSEGMPNVILEALACGLPVIATDVGNCTQILENEIFGRVVTPGAVTELTNALQWVLKIAPDRKALSRRHSNYTWQDQARRVLALFNNG